MGVVTGEPPCIGAQIGNIFQAVLLDSRSASSIISFHHFQQLNREGRQVTLFTTEVTCMTASEHSLDIMGEVKTTLKINQYSWPWRFLVGKRLQGRPILGADFISRSQLVLDLGQSRCYFRFASEGKIPFIRDNRRMSGVSTIQLPDGLPRFQCGDLSNIQKRKLEKVLSRYPDVLTAKLGLTDVLEYEIQVLDNTPVRLSPYRLSPPKMQFLRGHIKQLLKDGVIEPSNSHYSSPMFLVPKGEGNYRAVVDFRALNKRIAVESVPLPDVHSACHWFGKAKYFTTLDLNQAYHQIPLAATSRPLTAFCTDWNLYQFARVPFGLATGAQVLTRLLDRVFQDLKFEFVYHYLDDVVIYSETFEEHLVHVNTVLERLRSAGLTVKPEKVVFATQEISFLGHVISQAGVRIDPERTRAIRDFAPPRDAKGISRFLGMVNFYHKFIPQLADLAEPLNALRKKGVNYVWGRPSKRLLSFLSKL